MKIELVTIGNEVLSGHTLNTNATFIAQELFKEGYKLSKETTILDDEGEISLEIHRALDRSDFVITTGGLGPTIDDISGKVVEKCLMSVPDLIPNHLGSAPGLMFHRGEHAVAMLPGVPYEMKAMLVESIIPYIKQKYPLEKKPYRKIVCFTGLFEITVDPILRELKEKYSELEFGIYPSLGLLQVHIYASALDEEKAHLLINPAIEKLQTEFADFIYESTTGTIQDAIQEIFVANGWTLGMAESCTGGSVASHLTQIPGASQYFLGSVVAYAEEAKAGILGVSSKTIDSYGAVSQEVVLEMVLGASRIFKSDFSVAITGIAGPSGGSELKPVGTVWFAIHRPGKDPISWKTERKGTRSMIINRSMNQILSKLYHYAKNES